MNMEFWVNMMANPTAAKDAFLRFCSQNGIDVSNLKEKSFSPVSFYDMAAIQAAGANLDLFGNRAAYVAANTNMKQDYYLPDDEHAVVFGMRILDGTNASITDTVWNYGSNLATTKNMLAKVVRDNIIQVNNVPLTLAAPSITTTNVGFIQFTNPFLLRGQTRPGVTLISKYAGAPAANTNVRVELVGFGLVGA